MNTQTAPASLPVFTEKSVARFYRSQIEAVADELDAELYLVVKPDVHSDGYVLTTAGQPDISEEAYQALITHPALRDFRVFSRTGRAWGGRPQALTFRPSDYALAA